MTKPRIIIEHENLGRRKQQFVRYLMRQGVPLQKAKVLACHKFDKWMSLHWKALNAAFARYERAR